MVCELFIIPFAQPHHPWPHAERQTLMYTKTLRFPGSDSWLFILEKRNQEKILFLQGRGSQDENGTEWLSVFRARYSGEKNTAHGKRSWDMKMVELG
jgi:hypothetical protein